MTWNEMIFQRKSPADAGITLTRLYVSNEKPFRFFKANHIGSVPL